MSRRRRTTYLSDRFNALPFCPGCGHAQLVKAIDRALVELQPEPSKVVIVTDIGCIGLSDRYFITSAFHGLHGRSITYACGMKLARPELCVIVLMGDGGCGIGATHLLNVARRNIGITLIVANNLNYGMTGGQHSVTTPLDGVTASSPGGNIETPMDLCATVAAAGGSWVYRTTAFEKSLSEQIGCAIKQPGFSMLEVWELCTAYYAQRNKLNKNGLLTLLDRLDFTQGSIADRPRPEYSEQLRKVNDAGRVYGRRNQPTVDKMYESRVTKQTGIVIAGSAGQKIKSTATLFAQAAMLAGLYATQKDDYPITVRTGHSVSEIILSSEPVAYTGIESPDYVIVLSEEGLKSIFDRFSGLAPSCTVYIESAIDLPQTKAKTHALSFRSISESIGKMGVSIVAIAAFLESSGLFPMEALSDIVERLQDKKVRETNLQAIALGATEAPKIDKKNR